MKKSKKAAAAPVEEEFSENDMEGLEEQDGFSDEEADEEEQQFANADAKGLEAARSYVVFSSSAVGTFLTTQTPAELSSTMRISRSQHSPTNSTWTAKPTQRTMMRRTMTSLTLREMMLV